MLSSNFSLRRHKNTTKITSNFVGYIIMWILNQLLWVISIGIFYVEAMEPVQDYLSPRAWQAIINSNGWRTLNQTVLSKPYDPKKHPKGMYVLSCQPIGCVYWVKKNSINLGLAENWLIQDELKEYLQHNVLFSSFFLLPSWQFNLFSITVQYWSSLSPDVRAGSSRLPYTSRSPCGFF